MKCEEPTKIFKDTLDRIQSEFKSDMTEIAEETQSRTTQLEKDFEAGTDLGAAVGTGVGGAVGGVVGGAPGAAAGAVIGKVVGSLFVIELGEQTVSLELPVPEFALVDQEWTISVPKVEMKDEDIIFNIPTLVMKTVEGPPIPETTVKMKTECYGPSFARFCLDVPVTTITWKKTFLDVPEYQDREHRIVIGIPQVTMVDEKMTVGVPTVTVSMQKFSMTIPTVTVKFAKDAGAQLAAAATSIAADAKAKSELKKQGLANRFKTELLPPAQAMFECHRSEIVAQRTEVDTKLSEQVEVATNSLVSLQAKGVPLNDDDYVAAQAKVDQVVRTRSEQLAKFDHTNGAHD